MRYVGLDRVVVGHMIMQYHVQQGLVHTNAAVVFKEAELAKAIHKEADAGSSGAYQRDPSFNLTERGKVLAPVVELSGAGIAVIRHILRCLQGAAILQEDGDAGSPEGVI